MERLRQILEQIKNFLGGMSRQQRITAVVGGLFILLALAVAFYLTSRPDFVPVFTGLSEQDAGAITTRLKDLNVQIKLDKGGTVIMVPSKEADKIRLQLASEGLPQGGGIGWEFLDKNTFGDTDFTMNKKNLRAMQTELTRTIGQITGVEQVRVHLALPEEKLYLDQKQETTASIMLRLRPGTPLKQDQIRGIVHLVARSVPGLKPENVTVVDTHGTILSAAEEEVRSGAKFSAAQLEIQKKVEKEIQADIQSMLDNVVGYTDTGLRKAIVRVRAELEFDEKKIESQVFESPPLVRSQHKIEENYAGRERPGGVPGTTTNVPGGAQIPGYPLGASGGGSYNKKEETINNELTNKKESIVNAPGTTLKKVRVGVLVDSTLQPGIKERIEKVVTAVAGIDLKRGDTIQVESVPFDYDWMEQEIRSAEKEQKTKEIWEGVGTWVPLTLLAVLLVWGILALWRLTKDVSRERVPDIPIGVPMPEMPPPSMFVPPAPAIEEERAAKQEFIDLLKRKGAQTTVVLEEVEQFVHSKPEVAAELVRSWLTEK